jgi:short-subunit dehydrogenase
MRKAVIIGATSGIGRALAIELSTRGYALGIAGRRSNLLQDLQQELAGTSVAKSLDLAKPEEATEMLTEMISELGGLDVLVIASGIGGPNPGMLWELERRIIAVNVDGFVAMATAGYRYFAHQGQGHLVGISSIAGIRGSRFNPAYSASKAFVMNYLEALRARGHHEKIDLAVTDIRPGFVETPLTHGQSGMFWVATAETAARQIADAIEKKRRVAYITHRWALIAWFLRHVPDWLVQRF